MDNIANKTCLFWGICFLFCMPAFPQARDSVYNPLHQEKVYLHFDQTAYFLKETIWFNAYVLDESNRPTDISRVLYVELVSPEGGVVDTFKGKIENSTCHGQFHLDSAYLSGLFEVRAYTRHMMNFGEDNYFSRVFPVFDIPTDGNYHIRSILNRTRPDLSDCRNRTTKRKRGRDRKKQHDTLPLSVQRAINSVIRHNRHFHPDTVHCDKLPENLSPGEKVELMFQTVPNSTFSLSVTTQADHIPTNYKGNICQNLFRDSSWVARSYHALRKFNPQNAILYAPEAGITVDGDFFKETRGKKKFLPQATVSMSTLSDSIHFGGNMKTNPKGQWSFTLDDFYGTQEAIVNAVRADFFWNESRIRMYKWFSPTPKRFSPSEYKSITYHTNVNATEENIKELEEVTVRAKKKKWQWRGTTRSLVHYSCPEEWEYALDQTGEISFDGSFSAWRLAGNVLSRYYYPERYARILNVKEYHGDHVVPEGDIHDGRLDISKDIKEIIIRTDRAACTRYDYSRVPFQRNIEKNPTGTLTIVHKYKSLGISIEENPDASNMKYLNYLVCLIPYSDEELKNRENKPHTRLSPTSRITVIHGFTRPEKFHAPDYELSHGHLEKDFRRTLYWNPEVKTDERGIACVTFYNNANCRSIHISAEGIGEHGNPIIYYNKEDKK